MNQLYEFPIPGLGVIGEQVSVMRIRSFARRICLVAFSEVYSQCTTLQDEQDRIILARHEQECGDACFDFGDDFDRELQSEYAELPGYLQQKENEKNKKKKLIKARMDLTCAQRQKDVWKIMRLFCDNPVLFESMTLEQLQLGIVSSEKAFKMPGKKVHDQIIEKYIAALRHCISEREKEKVSNEL